MPYVGWGLIHNLQCSPKCIAPSPGNGNHYFKDGSRRLKVSGPKIRLQVFLQQKPEISAKLLCQYLTPISNMADHPETSISIPAKVDPTKHPSPLCLRDAPLLLSHPYLPMESGFSLNSDGMHHIAASTYMPQCSGAMIDWWFGWIHTTDQYKL